MPRRLRHTEQIQNPLPRANKGEETRLRTSRGCSGPGRVGLRGLPLCCAAFNICPSCGTSFGSPLFSVQQFGQRFCFSFTVKARPSRPLGTFVVRLEFMTDWISEEGLIKYRWSTWQGPGAPSRLPPSGNRIKIRKLEQGAIWGKSCFQGQRGWTLSQGNCLFLFKGIFSKPDKNSLSVGVVSCQGHSSLPQMHSVSGTQAPSAGISALAKPL